ncbi:MAG: hypothetical protein LBT95_08255 [Treponema sp.]|nr:hypothetical protein [Treponema sp.]
MVQGGVYRSRYRLPPAPAGQRQDNRKSSRGLHSALSAIDPQLYGAGHIRILFSLVLPLSKEILLQNSAVEMITGVDAGDQESVATIKYATIVAATMPVLCIYPFL